MIRYSFKGIAGRKLKTGDLVYQGKDGKFYPFKIYRKRIWARIKAIFRKWIQGI
jgi:hypothetical protein